MTIEILMKKNGHDGVQRRLMANQQLLFKSEMIILNYGMNSQELIRIKVNLSI